MGQPGRERTGCLSLPRGAGNDRRPWRRRHCSRREGVLRPAARGRTVAGTGYGDEVLTRLAEDQDIRKRLLFEMLRLPWLFQKVPTSAQLGWSHYRVLLGVALRRARSFYVKQTEQHGWSVPLRPCCGASSTGTRRR